MAFDPACMLHCIDVQPTETFLKISWCGCNPETASHTNVKNESFHLNESVFLQHIRDNQGIIFKLVNLYAKDQEEQKDLCQEIIYQAWRGWPTFRGDAKFSTWLYRISLNTLLTYQRKARPVKYQEDLSSLPHAVDAEAGAGEEARLLYKAIRSLPETERALITMHLDGYGHAEIAAMAGITENHVAVKLHRIKAKLKEILNGNG
jgi:RNA polymerase sigma-70 factor (ECF subfamily)